MSNPPPRPTRPISVTVPPLPIPPVYIYGQPSLHPAFYDDPFEMRTRPIGLALGLSLLFLLILFGLFVFIGIYILPRLFGDSLVPKSL